MGQEGRWSVQCPWQVAGCRVEKSEPETLTTMFSIHTFVSLLISNHGHCWWKESSSPTGTSEKGRASLFAHSEFTIIIAVWYYTGLNRKTSSTLAEGSTVAIQIPVLISHGHGLMEMAATPQIKRPGLPSLFHYSVCPALQKQRVACSAMLLTGWAQPQSANAGTWRARESSWVCPR